MKFFIQGYFDILYLKNKDTLKNSYGSIYIRPPKKYLDIFDLDIPVIKRIKKMDNMFKDFILPYSEKALSLEGIKKLANENKLPFKPVLKEELNRLIAVKQQETLGDLI